VHNGQMKANLRSKRKGTKEDLLEIMSSQFYQSAETLLSP